MKRREFLNNLGIGATMAAIPGEITKVKNSSVNEMKENQPNILLIMTDQHRSDLMTCMGNELVPTPNIDRIAARGVRFENAYCPYPVCVASRMSLLTGLYPHHTGAINNDDSLDWRFRTIAHHFAENGYLTGLIGKMHFTNAHNHGFEYYMSINDWLMYLGPKAQHYANEIASHPHNMYFYRTVNDSGAGLPDIEHLWDGPNYWVGHVNRLNFDSMASQLEAKDHLDMFIARESVKFIQKYKEQPFLLVTSFMKPHTPFFPPREFAEKYPVDKMTLREIGDLTGYPKYIQERVQKIQTTDNKNLRAARAGYLGNLAFVDTCIGLVYDELEKSGLLQNTIVIYTSDHGEMDGTHGLYQKFCMFDPAAKVPLIISYPPKLAQNKVSKTLIENFGLYPTLSELAGLKPPVRTNLIDFANSPPEMDAKSFAEFVTHPDRKGPEAAYCEYDLRSTHPHYMIRNWQFKYIYNENDLDELYNLETDPEENINLIHNADFQKVASQLKEQLFACYQPEKNRFRSVHE
ncbi:sulfatase-like hydrolase/transferase [candidate division KSB1 bacterium]|nr:sulfatase-like hydrolase/transferase [candidate division KSB1 bacterium]